jgi:hypothetical protein
MTEHEPSSLHGTPLPGSAFSMSEQEMIESGLPSIGANAKTELHELGARLLMLRIFYLALL